MHAYLEGAKREQHDCRQHTGNDKQCGLGEVGASESHVAKQRDHAEHNEGSEGDQACMHQKPQTHTLRRGVKGREHTHRRRTVLPGIVVFARNL